MFITVLTWFEWDPKFGAADVISGIAAVLTLVAVIFSAIASNSAKESARIARESTQHTKKQTELMERDLINTHLPKIIPIPQNINIPVSKIHTSLSSNNIGVTTKFEIDVTNVTQGNAYMLSAWLEISNENLQEHVNDSYSPKSYNDLHHEGYKFRVYINDPYESIFTTLIMEEYYTTEVWQSPVRQAGYPISSILKQDEKHKIFIPDYVAKIILDSLYKSIDLPSSTKDSININKFCKLFIKYKTGNQLETSDDYTLRIYKLSITNMFITEPSTNDYGNIDESNFIFSIDFLFEDEI